MKQQTMSGIALFDVDLDALPHILRAEPGQEEAWVTVHRCGRPLGRLELALADGELSGHAIRAAALTMFSQAAEAAQRIGPNPPSDLALTVAVCTHERPEMLRDCLESLLAQDHTELTILVVDNAPQTQRTRDLVTALGATAPRLRYICEPRQGLDFARNLALAQCTTEVLAYVDDDTVAPPGWARGVATGFTTEPHAACVTGPVVPHSLDRPAEILFEQHGGFCRGFATRRIDEHFFPQRFFLHTTGICGTGANMAFRRQALLDVGGADPSLDVGARLPGGGDLDMFRRILCAGGLVLYEPTALLRHRHRPDMGKLRSQFYNWGRGTTASFTAVFLDQPKERVNVLRCAAWWLFRYQLCSRLLRCLLRKEPTRLSFIAIEILGGFMGPWALWRTRRYVRSLEP